jgi:hypothetical protein
MSNNNTIVNHKGVYKDFEAFLVQEANSKNFQKIYCKVEISCLEPQPGIYRLLMKGILDAYVLWPFKEK